MASIVGVIFASIALRARGVYFLMITMALTMVVWGLANRWVALTNGDSGISGIPAPDLGTLGSFDGRDRFYFLILVVFVSVFILFNSIVRSPFGKSLEGIRENEVRMESLGYNVWLHKFIVFVIAAALAGVAGTLWCYYNNFVSPVDTSFINSVEVFLMVALGGPGTIIGAVLGSALLVLIKNIVALYTQHWLLVVGCIYILLVLLRPGGLMRASQNRGLVRHSTAY
jgi:branched-chain amino acid transport system permease protein